MEEASKIPPPSKPLTRRGALKLVAAGAAGAVGGFAVGVGTHPEVSPTPGWQILEQYVGGPVLHEVSTKSAPTPINIVTFMSANPTDLGTLPNREQLLNDKEIEGFLRVGTYFSSYMIEKYLAGKLTEEDRVAVSKLLKHLKGTESQIENQTKTAFTPPSP